MRGPAEVSLTGPAVPCQERGKEPENLLLIAFYYPPQNTSGAQRPHRFVKNLAHFGYQARVVTRGGESDAAENVFRTAERKKANHRLDATSGIIRAMERILPYRDQLPWVPYAVSTAEEVIARHRIRAIVSTSPPAGAHLAAAWIKRRHRIPWIADFRDPIRGNPFRTEWWGQPYDRMLEGTIVTHANIVIANTDTSADMLRSRYPAQADRIHLIWNGFDSEEVLKAQPIPIRGHRVLLHTGSIYGGRHPGALLASLKRLISNGRLDPAGARVRLVGELELETPWYQEVDLAGLVESGLVELVDRQVPRREAQEEMARADYLVLLDMNEHGVGLQVPGKLFEYIPIGRPVMAFTPADSPTERILAQSGIPHVCVTDGAPGNVVDARLLELLSLPVEPVPPSDWFLRNFDARSQTEELCLLLESLPR